MEEQSMMARDKRDKVAHRTQSIPIHTKLGQMNKMKNGKISRQIDGDASVLTLGKPPFNCLEATLALRSPKRSQHGA
jgi:hypothetical protein